MNSRYTKSGFKFFLIKNLIIMSSVNSPVCLKHRINSHFLVIKKQVFEKEKYLDLEKIADQIEAIEKGISEGKFNKPKDDQHENISESHLKVNEELAVVS